MVKSENEKKDAEKLRKKLKNDLEMLKLPYKKLLEPTNDDIVAMLFNLTLHKARLEKIDKKGESQDNEKDYKEVYDIRLKFIKNKDRVDTEDLTLHKARLEKTDKKGESQDNEKDYKKVHDIWLKYIQKEDGLKTEDLISLVALLVTRDIDEKGNIKKRNETKETSRELKASREAILAEIGRRNACNITNTMNRLDKSASFLSKIAILLAIIQCIPIFPMIVNRINCFVNYVKETLPIVIDSAH